jgi:hypothetical protein
VEITRSSRSFASSDAYSILYHEKLIIKVEKIIWPMEDVRSRCGFAC